MLFYSMLDEQQRRLFAGFESIKLGHGGDSVLAEFLGLESCGEDLELPLDAADFRRLSEVLDHQDIRGHGAFP